MGMLGRELLKLVEKQDACLFDFVGTETTYQIPVSPRNSMSWKEGRKARSGTSRFLQVSSSLISTIFIELRLKRRTFLPDR